MKTIFSIIITCLTLNAQTTEQIKKQLSDTGVTPEQAKQMARDKGYTDNQIEAEARTRNIDLDGESAESDIQPVGNLQGELVEYDSPVKLVEESKIIDPLKYFGYQIFLGDPSAFQSSTFGAVDPNYIIGPSDQIIVMLHGMIY